MTENVIDMFTKEKVDRRKTPSNQIKGVFDRMISYSMECRLRSVVIVAIDENGQHVTDYLVIPEDFSKSCVVLGAISDEMSDLSLGYEDLEEEET